jgi:hypothetical protein
MSLERTKTLSDIIATWAGLFALIGGGLFGLFQYLEKKEDDRVASASRLLERFHTDRLQKSYLLISGTWQRNNAVVNEAAVSKDPSDLPTLILTIIDSEGMFPDIQALLDFYEVVAVCIDQRICDEATAMTYFHKEALAFFRTHTPFIDRERAQRADATYACRLEQFALARKAPCKIAA